MFINLLFSLVLSTSMGVTATPLYKKDIGPLFGPSGIPSPDDLQQHHLDCAYVASMMTLTDRAPEFVKSLISFEGDYNAVEEVTATCWTLPDDKEGKVAEMRKTKIRVEDVRHRNDSKTDIWWPGALYQAPIHEGIVIDPRGEGGMPALPVKTAMMLITGKQVEEHRPKDLEEFWQLILKVNESPMTLQTKVEGTKTILGKHGYAIAKAAEETPGNRMVDLINTDGKREHLTAEQVFEDTSLLANWAGYPSFVDERAP